ncbi:MAG: septum formation inhibitor Maf, partial [Actinobacteria bacterium]|nr:Maf-like protein [Actinomycetota bacterium]NIS29539.1 Maf-like protein [Actinomycetota bacterium]NIU64882.1 Maf-like protein [Actinomycetota bacterium]NIV86030.1 septum formation inhibitor Maf [Actinomycetota bacterium]NIW26691.1 septum formation inhibitor Maf [Actinomycetota bacterium]
YAMQELGGAFVERIEGDPWNVVGLPLRTVYRILRDAGALPF